MESESESEWNQNQGDQKGQTERTEKGRPIHCQVCGKSGHQAHQCWWNNQQQGSQTQQSSQTQGKFTISWSILRINQSDSTSRSALRFSRSTTCSSTTSTRSESSIHGQVGGLSGHRLNSNHFTQPTSSESGVKEICASLPYPIRPSLPHHLQEAWAALIDTGAVTSIAPSSFAPHVPVTPHACHLVKREWWRHHDQGSEDGHIRSPNCHEHRSPHCR